MEGLLNASDTRVTVNSAERRVQVRRRNLLTQVLASLLVFIIGAVVAGENLLSDQSTRQFAKRYGQSATQRLSAWEQLMRDHHDSPEQEKLQQVNAFFNQLPWVSD